ncbi:MAG: N-acetyl-gamma-glutamyl-phosphate reductase [Thermoanaerobacterales bacterium]|nr:N-acetyl-gamma-glutamyl-phosphate reductase [Thermoanaerobacterales bacterium]
MIKAGVIGATGYAGAELVRLLARHPAVRLAALTSRSYAERPLSAVYPHLYGHVDEVLREFDPDELVSECDVVFTALPHGHAMEVGRKVLDRGKKLVDIGADFRLADVAVYEEWYRVTHTAPEILPRVVYGLPELNREHIAGAPVVANPGCYPTASILALAPALKAGLADPASIIIDAKSGVSGAGRGLSLRTHFAECNENFQAYGVPGHRHTPEIEQELSRLAGRPVRVSFTPHLAPMNRGILATVYFSLSRPVTADELHAVYREFYSEEPFVRVLPPGTLPQTKAVAGSNHCDLNVVADARTGRAVVLSAIDNLVKGAAGQAVQNMNIMFGRPEGEGLAGPGLYP